VLSYAGASKEGSPAPPVSKQNGKEREKPWLPSLTEFQQEPPPGNLTSLLNYECALIWLVSAYSWEAPPIEEDWSAPSYGRDWSTPATPATPASASGPTPTRSRVPAPVPAQTPAPKPNQKPPTPTASTSNTTQAPPANKNTKGKRSRKGKAPRAAPAPQPARTSSAVTSPAAAAWIASLDTPPWEREPGTDEPLVKVARSAPTEHSSSPEPTALNAQAPSFYPEENASHIENTWFANDPNSEDWSVPTGAEEPAYGHATPPTVKLPSVFWEPEGSAEEPTWYDDSEPIEQAAAEPLGHTEEPLQHAEEEPVGWSTEEPFEQTTEPIQRDAEGSAERIAEDPAQWTVEGPAEQFLEEQSEQAVDEPSGQAMEEPIQWATEDPAEETLEEPLERADEGPVQLDTEDPTKEMLEEPLEQAEAEPIQFNPGYTSQQAVEEPSEAVITDSVEEDVEESIHNISKPLWTESSVPDQVNNEQKTPDLARDASVPGDAQAWDPPAATYNDYPHATSRVGLNFARCT
jgi:hypothetical protein